MPKTATKNAPAKPMTKSALIAELAMRAELPKKSIASVLAELEYTIHEQLDGKKAPGAFVLPGICKFKVARKPAQKAKPGRNPFTGAEMMIAAKPARNVVKIIPAKPLRDSIA